MYDLLNDIFSEVDEHMIKSALKMSNNEVNIASLILLSKNKKTINSLYKIYNSDLHINSLEVIDNVRNFLDLPDSLSLYSSDSLLVNMLTIDQKNLINQMKNIFLLIDRYYNYKNGKELKSIDNSVYTCSCNLEGNLVYENQLKDDLDFVSLIQHDKEIPSDYKTFIKMYSLKKIKYPQLIIINYSTIKYYKNISPHIPSKSIPLLGRFGPMGIFYIISFTNYINEDKYFLSCIGGSNGYECYDNFKHYINMTTSEIKNFSLEESLNHLFENYPSENIIS